MSALRANLRLSRTDFELDTQLEVPLAGITGIFGPSGSGKTTLLRALAGLEKAAGTVQVDDQTWQSDTVFLPPQRRQVGMVFQEPSLFSHLDVAGNLDYGYRRTPAPALQRDAVIELLGLESLLRRRPDALSGGERQRVAIGRALLRSPRLLLMDEPLAALDVGKKRELMPFLEKLHAELKLPILYVSHLPDEVARLADHLVLMERGRVTAAGQIDDLLTRFDLPLAHEHDASALVKAQFEHYDAEYDLSVLGFSGGELTVPGRVPEGRFRARILARDVSLTLDHQPGTSILNILPVTVTEISDDCGAQQLVKLDAGGTTLLARITRKSASVLELRQGKTLYAQIKSVAILDP